MAPAYTKFKGVGKLFDPTLNDILKINLNYYLDWSFIGIGGYHNVNIPTSGNYGGDMHKLRGVDDPYRDDGRVWEGFRSNWVWESGIVDQSPVPISISGVFVDNVFHSGGLDHHIDYPNGRIVFDSGISTTAVVQLEYSFKHINIYDATDVPWFKEIQRHSFRVDSPHFDLTGSGDWSQMAQTRLQLPAVIIDFGEEVYLPYQLGGGQWAETKVIFHVFAEDGPMVHRIADIIAHQNEKTIFLFSPQLLSESGVFPLDFQGSIVDDAKTYPELVEQEDQGGFRWRRFRFSETVKQKSNNIGNDLYHLPVRTTGRVTLTEI